MPQVSLNPVYRGSHEIVSPKPNSAAVAPLDMAASAYEGPKALGFSKYASPAKRKDPLAVAPAIPHTASSTPDNTIATKEQLAVTKTVSEATPPAAELAVEQGAVLKKEVEQHTAKFSGAVSSAVVNTRQLLLHLREASPGADAVDHLWQELEQLFKAANEARVALPQFMEKQRDNMSLYHSSMMNETFRETQQELNLQHKKVNTQHDLILEQQDAFQSYKAQTASKLKELDNLQERISRLTLEKGNFRTEVDKYKELLEQESTLKAKDLATAEALQRELEGLVTSKEQLQADNNTLRKTTTDLLEQLKTTEQRVTNRFADQLKAKAEQLQKETSKTTSLSTLVTSLKDSETTVRKEFDKLKGENRLLAVKYTNQAAEHAAAFTKAKDQNKKIESLTADVIHLQKQNADLLSKLEKAAELEVTNTELLNARDDLRKQLDSLAAALKSSQEAANAAQGEVEMLKARLATKAATPVTGNDKALLEMVQSLEEKNHSLEAALVDWTKLAKRSYNEYKEMLPMYKDAHKYKQDAQDMGMQITQLKQQLAAAKVSQSNGVGATGGDSAYWKQKYENLLTNI